MVDPDDTATPSPLSAGSDDPNEDIASWFTEAIRLLTEASERVAAGELRPALSSLGAFPQVHKQLVVDCAQLLEQSDRRAGVGEPHVGMYL